MRKVYVLGVAPLMVLGLGACGDDDDDGASVDVTLSDFEIQLGETSAPAGKVTFEVHNDGPSMHEFVVFNTDLAPEDLPLDDEGNVAESDEFDPVDEIEDIEDGADPKLALDLEAGDYVVICNIPLHYGQGMHAAFTVT